MRWSPSMTPVWLRWRAQSISFVAWTLATVLGVSGMTVLARKGSYRSGFHHGQFSIVEQGLGQGSGRPTATAACLPSGRQWTGRGRSPSVRRLVRGRSGRACRVRCGTGGGVIFTLVEGGFAHGEVGCFGGH